MSDHRWGWDPIPNLTPPRALTPEEYRSACAVVLSDEPDRPALRAVAIALMVHAEALTKRAEKAKPDPAAEDLCSYCGLPSNSSACQKSHP